MLAAAQLPVRGNELTFAVAGRANSTPWVAAAGQFVAVAWGATGDGKGDIMIDPVCPVP